MIVAFLSFCYHALRRTRIHGYVSIFRIITLSLVSSLNMVPYSINHPSLCINVTTNINHADYFLTDFVGQESREGFPGSSVSGFLLRLPSRCQPRLGSHLNVHLGKD